METDTATADEDFDNTKSSMSIQEKQRRRSSMIHKSRSMPAFKRRDSMTAEDDDICALRARVLSKIAQDKGKTPTCFPSSSPPPVKFTNARRCSDQVLVQTEVSVDGLLDLSICDVSAHVPRQKGDPEPSSNSTNDEPDRAEIPEARTSCRRFSSSMPSRKMSKMLSNPVDGSEDCDGYQDVSEQVERVLNSVEDTDPSVPRLSKYLQWVCSKLRLSDHVPLLVLRKAENFRVHHQDPATRSGGGGGGGGSEVAGSCAADLSGEAVTEAVAEAVAAEAERWAAVTEIHDGGGR